ncbi:dnaJ homolog subfamily C member 7 [Phlebotomus papatasi]|uniref:dnaJ homolog subfamily C member 7 n=1 Tax=Phlebotomus papatasi TaxID=29031 RepID=UPI0024846DEA|nr:dnaJ homolog subfamily C member 7 [Phlebotomus papatasi]
MDTSPIVITDDEEVNVGSGTAMDDDLLPQDSISLAEKKKDLGNEQYKIKNYSAALKLYSDAISLCPNLPAFFGNRAACHMMLGDYKQALSDARQAIDLDPSFEKGFIRIAKCCLMLGDLVGVEQAVKALLNLEPRSNVLNAEIQSVLQLRDLEAKSVISYDKKDFRTTVFQMDSALKIAPACQRYKLLKAECLALLGRVEEANDIAVNVMKTDSTAADAVFVRGLCLYYLDNLDKSVIHFQRTLSLDPDHQKAKVWRVKTRQLKEKKDHGNELFKAGKFREAHVAYSEALQIDEGNKEVNSKLYYNRALMSYKLDSKKDSVKDCNSALNIKSDYLKAILLRAKCHNELEEYEECVRDYEQALKLEKTQEIKGMLRDAKLALKRSKRKDYYKILGVGKNATDDEIKKAYRKRALIHHPDRHANSTDDEKKEQEKKFKEVGQAYSVLSDPQKKARYDSGHDIDETGADFDPTEAFQRFFFSTNGGSFNFHFQ